MKVMDILLFASAVAFGIGALAKYLGRFGGSLNWISAGLCLGTLSFLFTVKV